VRGRALLDTSAVLLLGSVDDPDDLPAELFISTITLAELSVGPLVTDDDTIRAARQSHLQQAEADFDPLPLDAAAARAFGRVAAALRSSGRKPAARAYDALIASIALANRLPVITANPKDFGGIPGLEIIPLPLRSAHA
jgi:tRNA(fMet)-specific endonuclease VapC